MTWVETSPVAPLDTRFGSFALHRFATAEGGEPALALTRGDVGGSAPLLARVHSSCLTSEFVGGLDCDCAEQLANALATIAAAGRGVLVYLMQEGRGSGLVAKARDRMMVQSHGERITTFEAFERMGLPRDRRCYRAVAELLPRLGAAAPLRLLTHNPEKRARLEAVGVRIRESVGLPAADSPWNAHYLAAKARDGHALAKPEARGARLPERVAWFEPHPVPELPRFVRAARYLLPVPEGWLRAGVYWDRASRRERLVLAPLTGNAGPRLVQAQALVDRLPLRPAGATQAAWRETAAALVAEGRGRALLLGPDEGKAPDADTLRLLGLDEAA